MGIIQTGPGYPGTVNAASGGKTRGYNNIGAVLVQVLPINPSRQKITFHVPNTVNDIFVAPAVDATGATLSPSVASPGGAYRIFAGGTLVVDGECQTAWNAIAAAGTNQSLTVTESNI